MAYEVIYLTGVPGSGKTSLGAQLSKELSPCEHIEYGSMLTMWLQGSIQITQPELRVAPSKFANHGTIQKLDDFLIERITEGRRHSHFILDSHAVTLEPYGFRVTGFSPEALARLSPSIVVLLNMEPSASVVRVKKAGEGRPSISHHQAATHSALQAQVATCYALQSGVPLYVLDGETDTPKLVSILLEIVLTGDAPRNTGG
jgi:adenylate kinase